MIVTALFAGGGGPYFTRNLNKAPVSWAWLKSPTLGVIEAGVPENTRNINSGNFALALISHGPSVR